MNTATATSRLQKKFFLNFFPRIPAINGKKRWPPAAARQNMACDTLTRAAAKGKNQKAKVADVSQRLPFRRQCRKAMRLGNVFLPFAFCLLPFAFVRSTLCEARYAS
jgi:hypothetical protein